MPSTSGCRDRRRRHDAPASDYLLRSDPWNGLIGAVGDLHHRRRTRQGVGARPAPLFGHRGQLARGRRLRQSDCVERAPALNVTLDCVVTRIDHPRPRECAIETSQGHHRMRSVDRHRADLLPRGRRDPISPTLPDKLEAAARLPLGLNNKLFLSLARAEEFETGQPDFRRYRPRRDRRLSHAAVRTPADRGLFRRLAGARTGGRRRRRILRIREQQLVQLLGSDFARASGRWRIHRWGADLFSARRLFLCGAGSCAGPRKAGGAGRRANSFRRRGLLRTNSPPRTAPI